MKPNDNVKADSTKWLPRPRIFIMAILTVALLLRLRGLAFGLPALLDPDEPIFVILGLKLLRNHTLNPGWFGHPGSTTIYALALIEIGVYGIGHILGRFPNAAAFTSAIYTDPGVVFLPGRIFILLCGLACVWLTWRLARALFDDRVGLIAASLMAIDPLQIRYSQIIRTDMEVTVFILLSALAAVRFVRHGKTSSLVIAGIALGFACATKWPAATVVAGILGACAQRWSEHPIERRRAPMLLVFFAMTTVLALFVASPFIFLDYGTVFANVRSEGQAQHLGATGSGPLGNLWWYVSGPMSEALGVPGLVLAAFGILFAPLGSRRFGSVMIPTAIVFLGLLLFQHLVWERWVIPLLPILSIALAWVCVRATSWVGQRYSALAVPAIVALAVTVALPPLLVGNAQAVERNIDTRSLATAWLRDHASPGSSITLEYLAFDILSQPWHIAYPLGEPGCLDARKVLAGKISVSSLSKLRGTRSVVDIGNIPPEKIASCRANFIVSSNWDRYRAESLAYPAELRTYAMAIKGARLVATFTPVPGKIGGPIVRIWYQKSDH